MFVTDENGSYCKDQSFAIFTENWYKIFLRHSGKNWWMVNEFSCLPLNFMKISVKISEISLYIGKNGFKSW